MIRLNLPVPAGVVPIRISGAASVITVRRPAGVAARVHLKGAFKNGCTAEQIQEILLLLTMYCGIPAANEAHCIAADVLREQPAS